MSEPLGTNPADGSSPPAKPSKFSVYQNPALSAALTANSLRPKTSAFLYLCFFLFASAITLLHFLFRKNEYVDRFNNGGFSGKAAYYLITFAETILAMVFVGTTIALAKAISLMRARNTAGVPVISLSKEAKDQIHLTTRQLSLLGVKSKVGQTASEPSKKPPKSKLHSASDALVPLHHSITTPSRSSHMSNEKSDSSGGNKMRSYGTPSKSPSSSSPYHVTSTTSLLTPVQASAGLDQSPWSNKRSYFSKDITTAEKLEEFLAEVDEKISESAGKLATPPPTISGFGITSPATIASPANTSGTTRSTPLRPVRMSPGSQKFTTPPKKGEGELPSPLSMEESIASFEHLGIYPQIEHWRDNLRQWFSSFLIKPLLNKIDTSHIQVMQSAAKLGISVTINAVGSDSSTTGTPTTISPLDRTKEWQPTFTLDEDGLLHQLRATLVQALDSSMSKLPFANVQQSAQQNAMVPIIQECIDAITEHQKLHALMKGELIKGLLPQSSVRADYMLQRVRELGEGTCLKNYEYVGNGEVTDKVNKKYMAELPTDSHLLIYLFCAFLDHPKWMLHVDSASYAGAQSIRNPLFLGVLPPKESFPEKYVAIMSSMPSVDHPGACILVIGKQRPPVFALYWEKKAQFSLQATDTSALQQGSVSEEQSLEIDTQDNSEVKNPSQKTSVVGSSGPSTPVGGNAAPVMSHAMQTLSGASTTAFALPGSISG